MRKRALGLAVALIVGAFVVSASGAATAQAQKVTTISVSTRASVVAYLRSIHVNAKHAVIQRGLRNYAGANCPSKHWTCSGTRHTVVQIAKRGGQNRFLCKRSNCTVVQISGASHGVYAAGRIAAATPNNKGGNSGYCVKTGSGTLSGGGQTCSISQLGTSGGNTAGIYEVTSKVSGVVQTVQFAASISQSGSGDNTACVTQGISQTGSTSNTNGKPLTVDLEATQSISILQDTATGNNYAIHGAQPTTGQCDMSSPSLSQYQNQTSIVSATGNVTQYENQFTGPSNTGNVSLDIEQNQGKTPGSTLQPGQAVGTNSAIFNQATNQQAVVNTKNGATVTQQQNAPDGNGTTTPFSGIVGTVNQDSTGLSTAQATQDEVQCEDAANTSNSSALGACSQSPGDVVTGLTLTQIQNGPVGLFTAPAKSPGRVGYYHKGIGQSAQTSAESPNVDTFGLTQTSSQYTDKPGPGVTVNQVNTMQGDCTSSGNGSATGGACTASQTAKLNGGGGNGNGITSDGYTAGQIGGTGGPPPLVIFCSSGHNSCQPTPPPDPTLTATPPVDENMQTGSTSATFEFTDPARDATFNCILDNVTVPACGSPSVINGLLDGTKTYTGLPLGQHTFTVTATDSSGNPSGTTATFVWTVVPPCSTGVGKTRAAYNAIPVDIATCPAPSVGFEATATNEFGDEVTLDTTAGTSLQSMTVDFQSWACETGHWNTGDCASTPGHGFTIPGGITAKIYSDVGGAVGPVIASATVNPTIPYRPSADNTNCADGNAGKWFDSVAGVCRNGYSALVTFSSWSFPNGPHTFTNGEHVIWTVQYNTSHAGYNPIGDNTACFVSSGGCGYDSLNVGATSFPNAPYAGTDVNEDVAFRSYNPGYGPTLVPLQSETGWTGNRPLGKIVLG